ncbi:MAG: site-2 protease family protein [Anaerolineae bacterium]|nr:site-2 protease family protein [Anaerolineae bacterium]MDW8069061.1 site-2 protease family protein [Anaerolineae bacterium]
MGEWGTSSFLERLRSQLDDLMSVERLEVQSGPEPVFAFYGRLYSDPDWTFERLYERFYALGYTALLSREKDLYRVLAVRGVVRAEAPRPWVNLILFLATLLTVMVVGAAPQPGQTLREALFSGVPFAAALMAILLAHELAHYFVARRYGSPVSLPYFIPMPFSILGTMGAVIFQRSPMRDRRALFDIGIAGPLAGFIVAVPLLILGLLFTRVGRPSDFLPPQEQTAVVYQEGNSLLYLVAKYLVFGRILPDRTTGEDVWLSLPASPGGPVAFAAWAGLLVTALNLLPIGQLDGGHVAYALLGRRAWKLAYLAIGLMGALGVYLWLRGNPAWPTWIIWAGLGLLFGPRHPPPLNDASRVGPGRVLLGILLLLIWIVTFVPVPLIVIPAH